MDLLQKIDLYVGNVNEESLREKKKNVKNALSGYFGRNVSGGVAVFTDDGSRATQVDIDNLYPIGSSTSTRYEHPRGITISKSDARRIGLEIE